MAHTPSQYIVNRGVLANDGTGDTLRDSFGKLNEAVEALYETDLSQLGNVDTTGVANGNTLVYNSSTGNWEASSTVAASALNDLTDVTIAGATPAGQLYDGTVRRGSILVLQLMTLAKVETYTTPMLEQTQHLTQDLQLRQQLT